MNNKIKVLNRRAYGHRDTEFLALRILFIHKDLDDQITRNFNNCGYPSSQLQTISIFSGSSGGR